MNLEGTGCMFICGMIFCGIFWGVPGCFGWAIASLIMSVIAWAIRTDD